MKRALVAGIDEAGRGPLAGPVVAAAVILPICYDLDGLTDSKRLSPVKRQRLAELIEQQAVCWALGRAEVWEIDELNILRASLLAMRRACDGLPVIPQRALVDGNHEPDLHCAVTALIKGDVKVPAISAASILAKVYRDREMIQLDARYPGYGLAHNKGYATRMHLQNLRRHGATDIHRRSFAPVQSVLSQHEMAL